MGLIIQPLTNVYCSIFTDYGSLTVPFSIPPLTVIEIIITIIIHSLTILAVANHATT